MSEKKSDTGFPPYVHVPARPHPDCVPKPGSPPPRQNDGRNTEHVPKVSNWDLG